VEFADRGFDAAADLVEIFFRIRRGTSTSVKDLISAIETLIGGGNERCEQFVWTNPPTTSSTRQPKVTRLQLRDTRRCPTAQRSPVRTHSATIRKSRRNDNRGDFTDLSKV
jgi:hypothetical protein